MNERLIELLKQAIAIQECSFGEKTPTFEAVAGYLISKGVIIPPCKIGDTVYRIAKNRETWEVLPREVICMTYRLDYFGSVVWEIFTTTNGILGKTVFLTREEAEAALAERKNDG